MLIIIFDANWAFKATGYKIELVLIITGKKTKVILAAELI